LVNGHRSRPFIAASAGRFVRVAHVDDPGFFLRSRAPIADLHPRPNRTAGGRFDSSHFLRNAILTGVVMHRTLASSPGTVPQNSLRTTGPQPLGTSGPSKVAAFTQQFVSARLSTARDWKPSKVGSHVESTPDEHATTAGPISRRKLPVVGGQLPVKTLCRLAAGLAPRSLSFDQPSMPPSPNTRPAWSPLPLRERDRVRGF
jgi:hypothetical protein